MTQKRLFLFAGYDKDGIIDDALVHYTRAISEFGDIVLCMDSDCTTSELKKVRKYCVHTIGTRHGEYDFGSYKRAYIWATENLNLSDYDFVYLINDSVYGPLYNLTPYFEQMESSNLDAFGLVKNPHHDHPHIQSWFVGLRPSVFTTNWFDDFMHGITKLESKGLITREYEQGLTKRIIQHNLAWNCLYSARGRGVYNKIKKLYRAKMPFMKRVAFNRKHGALGAQVLYILQHIPATTRDAILSSARRVYGENQVNKLLTNNSLRILYRHIYHSIYKLFIKGV